jgi:hypothetical protein
MEKRTKIISAFEKNEWRKMRFRKPQRSDIAELLFTYLKHDTSDIVPVRGPLHMVTLFSLSFKLMYGLT